MKTILALSAVVLAFGSCAAKKATMSNVESVPVSASAEKLLKQDKFVCTGTSSVVPQKEFQASFEKRGDGYHVSMSTKGLLGMSLFGTYTAEVINDEQLLIKTTDKDDFILNLSRNMLFATSNQTLSKINIASQKVVCK